MRNFFPWLACAGLTLAALAWSQPAWSVPQEAKELKPDANAVKRARAFLAALAAADLPKTGEHLAPQVIILGGSLFHKPEWDFNPKGLDNYQNVEADRVGILKAYGILIEKIGRATWANYLGEILSKEDNVRFAHAEAEGKPFPGILKGDLVVTVLHKGPKDDPFIYALRADKKKQWHVVMVGQ